MAGELEGQHAKISLIDGKSTEEARIISLSGRKLFLFTHLPVQPWSAVQIEWPNHLILGEVLGVETENGSGNIISVRVVHAFDIAQLEQQRRHWF
jgi:hypothetical protein